MKRNGKVTPMTRLIERQEFEKRLADYTANVLKSFQHVLGLIASQQAEIERLKGEAEALKGRHSTTRRLLRHYIGRWLSRSPDITTERVEP